VGIIYKRLKLKGKILENESLKSENKIIEKDGKKITIPDFDDIVSRRYGEIGKEVYKLSVPHFLEICHDVEKSVYREAAFYKLLQFKVEKDTHIFAEDVYGFLEEAASLEELETETFTISPSEAALVTMGIDDWYNQYKIGDNENFLTKVLEKEWLAYPRDSQDLADESYIRLLAVSTSHVIGGQPLSVAEYVTDSTSEAMLAYLAITGGEKYGFTPQDIMYYSPAPGSKISKEDCGFNVFSPEFEKDGVWLAEAEENYVRFPIPSYSRDILSDVNNGVGYALAAAYYEQQVRRVSIHNMEVEMRENNLASYIDMERGWQSKILQQSGINWEDDAIYGLMRCYKTEIVTAEVLAAYWQDRVLQLNKISPSLVSIIQKVCPSLQKESVSLRVKLSEYQLLEKIVATHIDGFSPSFAQQAKDFVAEQKEHQEGEAIKENASEPPLSARDYVLLARGLVKPVD